MIKSNIFRENEEKNEKVNNKKKEVKEEKIKEDYEKDERPIKTQKIEKFDEIQEGEINPNPEENMDLDSKFRFLKRKSKKMETAKVF